MIDSGRGWGLVVVIVEMVGNDDGWAMVACGGGEIKVVMKSHLPKRLTLLCLFMCSCPQFIC